MAWITKGDAFAEWPRSAMLQFTFSGIDEFGGKERRVALVACLMWKIFSLYALLLDRANHV